MIRPCMNPASVIWPERNDVPDELPPRSQETARGRRWRKDVEKPIEIVNKLLKCSSVEQRRVTVTLLTQAHLRLYVA